MTQTKTEERTLVGARVEPELAQRFTALAQSHDRSVSAELRQAMRDRLDRENQKGAE